MNLYETVIPPRGETFTALLEHKNIKINRIVSSSALEPAEYMQDEDEWVVIIEGEACLKLNHEEHILRKGDMLFIPSHTPHTVLLTKTRTLWLTVHIG